MNHTVFYGLVMLEFMFQDMVFVQILQLFYQANKICKKYFPWKYFSFFENKKCRNEAVDHEVDQGHDIKKVEPITPDQNSLQKVMNFCSWFCCLPVCIIIGHMQRINIGEVWRKWICKREKLMKVVIININ